MTRIIGPPGSRRRKRLALLAPLVVALALVGPLVLSATGANKGGFEIDADSATAGAALYSGTDTPAGDDWAKGAGNSGVFAAHATGGTIAQPGGSSCYGSTIDVGDASGPSAFICDGNSDSKFKSSQPEQNIVSPSGKSPDASWPIKPGNVRPKNDFSHAYVYTRQADSPCTTGTGNTDTVLYLGGHVGDNEGDHFWGFEFDKNAPTNFDHLIANDGSSFTLGFNRHVGDILVSFTVPGNAGPSNPVVVEVFQVSGFNADGSAIFTLATPVSGCPAGTQGLTQLATNVSNDITAPPWNVPVCDPTAEDSANQCRLANGTNSGPPSGGDKTLAPRDFAEASVDLAAYGITPCFTNVVFTSRSAHVLTGADVQDVGGANFPLCGSKSGVKFRDDNGNGVKDSGEPGLNGWTMKLYKDLNSNHQLDANELPAVSTQQTATANSIDGSYSFSSLGTGDYILCEVQQATWFESRPSSGMSGLPAGETVANTCNVDSGNATNGYAFHISGADLPNNDFGNFQQGTKSGTKFEDSNANGTKDAGETNPTVGFTVNAYKDANDDGVLQDADDGTTDGAFTVAKTTTTSTVDGTYSMKLDPGHYVVCEVKQTGWTQSFPTASTTSVGDCSASSALAPKGWNVDITSGSTDSGNDFGNFRQGTKSGTKFEDANGNGVKDVGETNPSVSFTVNIYKNANNDAVLQDNDDGATDSAFTVVASPTTSTIDGTYSVNLDPGHYIACEVTKAGWTESFPKAATSGSADCSANSAVSPRGWAFDITSGSTHANDDFGNFRNGTIAGAKFKDLPPLSDATHSNTTGDVGLAGWTIHVYTDAAGGTAGTLDAGDTLVDTKTSAATTGAYLSGSLAPGIYYVCETGQTGWVQTYPLAATTGSTDCSAKTGESARGWKVTVTSGSTITAKDFGNTPLSHVTVGFVSDGKLSGGGDATKATSISCSGAVSGSLGTSSTNSLTSSSTKLNDSSITCTITFTDP